MSSSLKEIDLASLSEGMPGLSSARGMTLAHAAAVCLEDQTHAVGVQLSVTGTNSDSFGLKWSIVDEQQRRTHGDLQEATEDGASGLAILLMRSMTGKVVVDRSKKGPGFDYWLADNDDEGLPFAGAARLEVSGILSGSSTVIAARVRHKKAQIKPSDHLAPGYVAIVEFGRPTAHVELVEAK